MTHIVIAGLGVVGVAAAQAILNQGLAARMTFFDKLDAKAEGEAWDFAHAASLLPACEVVSLPYERLFGGDICIVSAGVKSRLGESRLDLLERNIKVADDLCDRLEKNGLPRILLVLTNPVDVMTEYFTRRLSKQGVVVFGSGTSLDTFRLRQIIAARANISASNVHAWVVGEHGDSSVSLFSAAHIGCVPLLAYPNAHAAVFQGSDLAEIETAVRCAAAKIIERKGATAHAIGLTTGRLVRAIVRNEKLILPVSVRVKERLCASVPCLITAAGPEKVIDMQLSESESRAYDLSLAVLQEACERLPTKDNGCAT